MNDLLLANLDPKAWRAPHPLHKRGEGRTIAGIFVHMHNCAVNWIRRTAPHLKCPAPLDPEPCHHRVDELAHRKSNAVLVAMLKDVLLTPDPSRRKIQKYSRGSWSQDWPAGATMFGYMFAHDAHHRGQIILLARELGFRLRSTPPTASGTGKNCGRLAGSPRDHDRCCSAFVGRGTDTNACATCSHLFEIFDEEQFRAGLIELGVEQVASVGRNAER